MWKEIEWTIQNAIGGVVYSLFGSVGVSIDYNVESNEIILIVYDKSYKCTDKIEVVNQKFKYDLNKSYELKAKADIVGMLEKYLIENYS